MARSVSRRQWFARDEAGTLRPTCGRPPFRQIREVTRRVQADGCINLDTNHYSVPWQLIGAEVTVEQTDGLVRVCHGGSEVARHPLRRGRRERAIDPAHLAGIVVAGGGSRPVPPAPEGCALLRPLAEYEGVAGGGW